MIYSDEFIWIHFPKNAGTKIEHLFEIHYGDENIFQDELLDGAEPIWHDTIDDRSRRDSKFSVKNKDIIVCTRKLPSWLVSRFNFECTRTPELIHRPELLLDGKFLESNGFLNHADSYIEQYLPKATPKNKVRYIKVENFAEDFKNIFGDYVDVSKIPSVELEARSNESRNIVSDEIKFELNNSTSLYEKCPLWKEMENLVYGQS
jgi:hypothetical protein